MSVRVELGRAFVALKRKRKAPQAGAPASVISWPVFNSWWPSSITQLNAASNTLAFPETSKLSVEMVRTLTSLNVSFEHWCCFVSVSVSGFGLVGGLPLIGDDGSEFAVIESPAGAVWLGASGLLQARSPGIRNCNV